MCRVFIRLLLVCGLLVLWDLAVVAWLGDGMKTLSAPERVAAQEAVADLSVTCLDNPIQRALTRHIQVVAVTGPMGCRWGPSYQVVIEVYSVLGIPLATSTHDPCKGEVRCYRDAA